MQDSLDELLEEIPMPNFAFTTPELTKQGFTSNEMVELMKGHDAAIVGDDVVDETVLSVPGLEFVCKWGAGVDGIDFRAAEKAKVSVANTPGVFGEDVADLALHYLIGLLRKTFEIDRRVRRGEWPRLVGQSMTHVSVVIYGYGSIGKSLANKLERFVKEIKVVDTLAGQRVEAKKSGFLAYEQINSALPGSNALIVCCPLTEETRHSINLDSLGLLEFGSYLVNVSRGQVVQQAELPRLLESKKLVGVALDVFEEEPLPMSSPLRKYDNVVLGSHNASSSQQSIRHASKMALEILNENFK